MSLSRPLADARCRGLASPGRIHPVNCQPAWHASGGGATNFMTWDSEPCQKCPPTSGTPFEATYICLDPASWAAHVGGGRAEAFGHEMGWTDFVGERGASSVPNEFACGRTGFKVVACEVERCWAAEEQKRGGEPLLGVEELERS